jgi:molecular chaperone GrpE (heat shock protein)
MASPQNPSPDNSDLDFETAISEVERQLADLKTRYLQVETDTERKQQLENRRDEIKRGLRQEKLPQLKAELQQIERELEAIEHNLESRLLDALELFWQIVRFLGLGIVIGWFLKSWSG